jgi:hypothetical protein
MTSFQGDSQKKLAVFMLLVLAQGAVFIGVQHFFTGTLCFPLDDAFIHLQYGKQLARGHYFAYQDDAAISSGETSFLYAHILALGYAIGFRGVAHLIWAHLITFASLTAMFFLLYRIGCQIASNSIATWAVALTFGSGYLAWGFWSGMENALFSALLLLCYDCLLRRRLVPLLLSASLLALCRPEGGIIAILLLGLLWLRTCWETKKLSLSVSHNQTWIAGLFFVICLTFPTVFNWIATGRTTGNSLLAKSLLYSPILTAKEKIALILQNLNGIAHFLSGSKSITPHLGEFIVPGMLWLALIGILLGVASVQKNGKPTLALNKDRLWLGLYFLIPLTVVVLAISTLEVWSLHSFRYLISYIPLFLLLAALGVQQSLGWLGSREPVFSFLVYIVALFLLAVQLPPWITRYAANATTIHEKQIQTAHWLNQLQQSNPRRVAINDAGALVYYGQFPILDLVGLVTNETVIPYRYGEGCLYEYLEQIPESERPDTAAVFPSWFRELAEKYDIFYQPLVTFHDPFDPSFGKTVYRVNWEYVGMADQPRQASMQAGWTVRDQVDIADTRSEEAHGYNIAYRNNRVPEIAIPFRRNFGYHDEINRLWPGIENEQEELIPFMKEKGILKYFDIVDAGRRVTGHESFTMANLMPDRDAHVILRTCDSVGDHETFLYRMRVYVDGVYAGDWNASNTPWNWTETVFSIPAAMIKNDKIHITVENIGSVNFAYFDSFYYWICQENE